MYFHRIPWREAKKKEKKKIWRSELEKYDAYNVLTLSWTRIYVLLCTYRKHTELYMYNCVPIENIRNLLVPTK